MMKMNTLKRVTLPNGRTFVAQYKRVSRAKLPANVTIRRKYTQRADPKNKRRKRGRQRGWGIFDFVKKVIKFQQLELWVNKQLNICFFYIMLQQVE